MNGFLIYFLCSGILLTVTLNLVIKNLDWIEEKFNVDLTDLETDLHGCGLDLYTVRFILPQLSLICLLLGWLLLPVIILQELLNKLGLKL